jgi:hypothetical protein
MCTIIACSQPKPSFLVSALKGINEISPDPSLNEEGIAQGRSISQVALLNYVKDFAIQRMDKQKGNSSLVISGVGVDTPSNQFGGGTFDYKGSTVAIILYLGTGSKQVLLTATTSQLVEGHLIVTVEKHKLESRDGRWQQVYGLGPSQVSQVPLPVQK